MKRLILLVALLMGGCAVETTTNVAPILQVIREDLTETTWPNRVLVVKSTRTGECYIGIYNVGLVKVSDAECVP